MSLAKMKNYLRHTVTTKDKQSKFMKFVLVLDPDFTSKNMEIQTMNGTG